MSIYKLVIVLTSINFLNVLCLDFVNANSTICETGLCIKKCCPENKFVPFRKKKCIVYRQSLNITLPLYDKHIRPTGRKLEDVFHLTPAAFHDTYFRQHVFESLAIGFNTYLTESGVLYLELPNAFERWTPLTKDKYCLDYIIPSDSTRAPTLGIWGMFDTGEMVEGNNFFTTGMIISCVFLVLVLVVYALLPELRNIGGLVLMAYDFSQLCAFIFLMVVQRGGHSTAGCIGITVSVYFFFLASFCWMNIMSFDIWWTFRGYAKARPIHRRGEKFKFCMYCLYAWGLPLAMSTGLYILNKQDLRHIPWFITPKIPDKGCFLEGGEKLVYLYIPMLIMIMLNWLFFLMTAFNIWRLSRGTAVLDFAAAGTPAAHRRQRHRLLVYLKLSILMGLNWILEVVSSFKPELNIWYVTDAYNLLIGLSIFLIFVCKKKILRKLVKRFSTCEYGESKWRVSLKSMRSSRSNSTTDSTISQEAPLQVCANPEGYAIKNKQSTFNFSFPNANHPFKAVCVVQRC